ncbi:MAG TPA: EscU/YscU/HrcU family type III secretion system export apparatus switch protein [Verrucomicrobiae bacterium]|jgi:flagellar biosynthetic protein FlhB
MADEQSGEKSELPSQKKLEEAHRKGQFAKSAEVQTAFVLMAAMSALAFSGGEMWSLMANTQISILGHLHDTPLSAKIMQAYSINAVLLLGHCVWPVCAATMLAGLLAGGLQTRFSIATEALTINWERLNPVEGFKRVFSMQAAMPTGLSMVKLSAIVGLSYSVIHGIITDPIFHSSVDLVRIAGFMADSSFKIVLRVCTALIVVASVDYTYQIWKTTKDLKMTRQEVKDESKNSEANPQLKAKMRRKRNARSKRKMLAEVPKADVIVVNPIHIAVALRYDRKTMKAPKVVAKGTRLNAAQIKEIAQQHQVPIIENIPLARMMFKYCPVGGEVPAQLYAAVAEVLAWVYRVNAYRYYREQSL